MRRNPSRARTRHAQKAEKRTKATSILIVSMPNIHQNKMSETSPHNVKQSIKRHRKSSLNLTSRVVLEVCRPNLQNTVDKRITSPTIVTGAANGAGRNARGEKTAGIAAPAVHVTILSKVVSGTFGSNFPLACDVFRRDLALSSARMCASLRAISIENEKITTDMNTDKPCSVCEGWFHIA
jgi:hypothetical protein